MRFFSGEGWKLERIRFADGTVWEDNEGACTVGIAAFDQPGLGVPAAGGDGVRIEVGGDVVDLAFGIRAEGGIGFEQDGTLPNPVGLGIGHHGVNPPSVVVVFACVNFLRHLRPVGVVVEIV